MRIVLLTAYFPPDVGAASHQFYELGQGFVARGHRVSVVTGFPSYHAQGDLSRYQGRRFMRERMAGMDVRRCRVPQVARDTPVGRGVWQFACAFLHGLAGFGCPRAEVALVYSPPLPLGLAALTWRALCGMPFVLNVQDLFPQSAIDLGVLRSKPLIRIFRALERFIYGQADAITVHSSGNRAHVLARGGRPETTLVVHNAVDTAHIRPGPRENDLRRELGLDGEFLASFAGVMGHSQDLDTILEAAHLLREQQSIRFLLVGDGLQKERLVGRSHELGLNNVIWLPMQPRARYPAILNASDLGLATLRSDVKTPVVPSKILSIMAAGRPVVAAMDLEGDAPRLIDQAAAGYCLPPGDPQALAETIRRLAADPELCRRLGENGRYFAEAYLSQEAAVAQYEALFTQVSECQQPAQARSWAAHKEGSA